jgi:N,N-dimethylformamidase
VVAGRWYRARAVLDLEEGAVSLTVTSAEPAPSGNYELELGAELPAAELVHLQGSGAPHHLVLAAWEGPGERAGAFNGKIEAPVVSAGTAGPGQAFVYAWRLGQATRASELHDTSTARAPLRLVNAPTAGVTGHNWDGTVLDFTKAPEQYDALAFHDDDFEDAGWAPVAQVHLPVNLRSGVYSLVVTNASGPRHVPFFVVPGPGRRRAKVAVLFSTFTYLAYANEHVREEVQEFAHVRTSPSPQDLEMAAHREFGLSLYDHHGDGTGVCYSSMRRPVVNFDPTYRFWLFDGPVHLGEDIYLLDWLERLGYDYDVLTDHQVHAEGAAALAGYRVVITGSHPEYASKAMLDALEGHVQGGGRLMYLGGNGHYWVTAVDPGRPHMIEIRRANSGGRTWESAPGEAYLSSTGEPGGLWRHRGRPPNRLLGVGFSAQGADERAPGYRKVLGEDQEARWGFVFEGVDDPGAIGEFGLLLGGAAGNEVDRADHTRGTPEGTVVLATSKGHSDEYQLAVEDILLGAPGQGGTEQPLVRADMVVVPYASGGTVFSVGAITWLGSLAYNNYDNDVAVITANVLRNFASEPRAD